MHVAAIYLEQKYKNSLNYNQLEKWGKSWNEFLPTGWETSTNSRTRMYIPVNGIFNQSHLTPSN